MGRALGDILPLAIAAAIRPATIVAVILLLGTPRARTNGLSFTAGYLAATAILATILLLVADLTGAVSDSGAPATWVGILTLVIGVLFLALALLVWTSRDTISRHPATEKWMSNLDGLSARQSLGIGAADGIANGKNLLLTMTAAALIAQAGIRPIEQIIAVAVFVAIAGICVLAPLAVYLVAGERAQPVLGRLRVWLVEHTPAIMSTLFLIIGVSLIGDAIDDLT